MSEGAERLNVSPMKNHLAILATHPVQYQAPWFSPLAQQNIHNAYHIGQIVLLRKLQGSWDRTKGVS